MTSDCLRSSNDTRVAISTCGRPQYLLLCKPWPPCRSPTSIFNIGGTYTRIDSAPRAMSVVRSRVSTSHSIDK